MTNAMREWCTKEGKRRNEWTIKPSINNVRERDDFYAEYLGETMYKYNGKKCRDSIPGGPRVTD